MECDIEAMWIEGDEYKPYFYNANDMKRTIISTENTITFPVRSLSIMPKQVAVHFLLLLVQQYIQRMVPCKTSATVT